MLAARDRRRRPNRFRLRAEPRDFDGDRRRAGGDVQRQLLSRRVADPSGVAFNEECARFVRSDNDSGRAQPNHADKAQARPNCEARRSHAIELADISHLD